jgi:hypothetical protein
MRRTNFGYGDKRALDLTPVSEMSLGKGGLSGLLVVTTPLVRGDSAPLVRCCFHRTTDGTPIARAGGTVKRSCIVLRMAVSGGTSAVSESADPENTPTL